MGFEMFKMVHMAEKSSYDSKWLCLVLTLSAMAPWDLIDIGQNVSNFAGLVWMADFQHSFGIILGLSAHFSKLIFALKP